jgi:hypothetical protein
MGGGCSPAAVPTLATTCHAVFLCAAVEGNKPYAKLFRVFAKLGIRI